VRTERLRLEASLPSEDPLAAVFHRPGGQIGIPAIDFDSRSRIRLNGIAQQTDDEIEVVVDEVFGNCPKFIQRRIAVAQLEPARNSRSRDTASLVASQAALIRGADTFSIASSHPHRGADASHRGGRSGFVEVTSDGRALCFPDYSGNRMFQTLGNLTVDPCAGLLFLDWEKGTALQLTGRARIVWEGQELKAHPGAERLIEYEIDAVHESERAMPARWNLVERSRLNPP
jgi:hypothetical protein